MSEIVEFPISKVPEWSKKSELIELFKIAKSSFYELIRLSQWLEDFEADYPTANIVPIKRAKLSRYQAWVIFLLNQYRTSIGIPFKELRKQLIEQSQLAQSLSKSTYLSLYTNE